MRAVFCLFGTMLAASPALASGGLSCEVKDEAVRFQAEGGVTRGMGGAVFSFRGDLEIRDKAVAADLRKISFERSHLAQYWLDGDELRLLLYKEREGDVPHGYVEIVVRTTSDEEGSYRGSYALTAFDMTGDTSGMGKTVTREGAVSCFVE